MSQQAPDERLVGFVQRADALRHNIEQAVRGKPEAVRLAVICLLAEGHLLVEDVPGVGKTSLARALAASIDGSWHRIQFTPDLLPSDVTGVTVYHQAREAFEFHPGPVFANLVIGDEINRASPRTQSALLEVMDERQVTVDAVAHPVPRPFLVIATQNPVDMDGTYPLPEAQLDRFLMRISLGYPDHDAEVEILESQRSGPMVERLSQVMTADEVATMIRLAMSVHVSPDVQSYIVRIAEELRATPALRLATSPRASLALMRAAQVAAAMGGRSFVIPEDVKALAPDVLAHRLIVTPEAQLAGRTPADLVGFVLTKVAAPTGADLPGR
jgi:MoxR-like ATPase